MSKHWNEKELDAYGHLNWTVGNSDWLACFDAIRVPGGIKYHVVVNCESGGFIDTPEKNTVALDQAEALLGGLPEYWEGIALENYPNGRGDLRVRRKETKACAKAWLAHIKELVKQPEPEEPEEEDHDEYGELQRAALARGQP